MRDNCEQSDAKHFDGTSHNGRTLDWRTLGARIRRAARVATAMHLIENADGNRNRKAVLETSPGKPGG
ncbi:MAG: hypothetical protein ACE5EC_09565 [Phycisphaerae bacterium]